ncbi:lipid droplet-associated protein [Nocardia rhizosphaerae]|uniref:Lipid droplet-associated protein n=1 Tax=Nocardia rhizosphaerae TaxID=1691571 RepID=A0ABV8L4Y0_9NOCA
MFQPPFLARVAAGAAVYAWEETRRLPTAAVNFPISAISRVLQTTMHVQQFVTSLALKGDGVFERLGSAPQEQPAWATFDEDLAPEPAVTTNGHASRFDLSTEDARAAGSPEPASVLVLEADETEETEEEAAAEPQAPEVAIRYDYPAMTLAQLRARLRMLTVEELAQLLAFEQQTRARAPFVTMLTNRIATVQAQ